ncbi:MAG: molybdopterin-dependent oxidoreductase, partial [Dehalococcoidia bacterium]|nr:molybdopterin-dependent oxidoreductase [Dehalococcoidia bacterium]
YGFTAGVNIPITALKMADARMRGMKVVVIDPVCTNAASKADEWIPIRPGTDGALALALLNVLINELKIYDAEFLKKHTNAPYLINASGNYIRETETNKPLVWDATEGKAKPFDAPVADYALSGFYNVDGIDCKPAFQAICEQVKQNTPEEAARITTVPAKTIRRIAKEFAEAAKIGSEIEIGGKKLPYRPVAVHPFKGVIAHAHATMSGLPFLLLNLMMGSMYVPGGYRGTNLIGPSSSWTAKTEVDGMLVPPPAVFLHGENYYTHEIGPKEIARPKDLLAFSMTGTSIFQLCLMHPERFTSMKRPCNPEMLIQCRSNLMMNCENVADTAQFLKSIPFIVCMDTEINETSEFADVVFPDTYYLERLNIFPNRMRINISPASNTFYWGIQQPVVEPAFESRDWKEVLIELADRAGFREDLNDIFNLKLGLKAGYKLERGNKYSYEEIADKIAKSAFGEKMGLEWFKNNGYHSIGRSVEENYPLPFINARIPVYFEVIKRRGEEARKVADSLGMKWWDTSDYLPIPVFKPCPAYAEKEQNPNSEFSLITVNYKVPMHYHTVTTKNPWLNEVAERHPYAYKIMINSVPAKKLGIKDGDMIWVESKAGKVKGRAKVTECIHIDAVGIAGGFGSWSKHKPIGKGKGVNFNSLLSLTPAHVDWISTAVDGCALVKVYKAEE